MGRQADEKLKWFGEMLFQAGNISYLHLDGQMNVLYGNLPDKDAFRLFAILNTGVDNMNGTDAGHDMNAEEAARAVQVDDTKGVSMPVIFTNSIGMSYISLIEGGTEKSIHVIGPVFLDDDTPERLVRRLRDLQLSVPVKMRFTEMLHLFPVVSLDHFYEYGKMLYYTVSGKTVRTEDFMIGGTTGAEKGSGKKDSYTYDVNREKYLEENRIIRMIESGNINFRKEHTDIFNMRSGGTFAEDYLRQVKNQAIILAALSCRAAVAGGIDAEIAYTLREKYIQEIEAAASPGEIEMRSRKMVEELMLKVHRRAAGDTVTHQIRDTCDYIELHISEPLEIHGLAQRLSYSDYYFSSKFRKETGETVNAYINRKRVEYACTLLSDGNDDIQEISARAGFTESGYFSEVFKKYMGMSPGQYRIRGAAQPRDIPK